MKLKILRSDFTSVREEGRACYLPDPSAPLPGPWIEVKGNGAYVADGPYNLCCGGVPPDFRVVELECEGPTGADTPKLVVCYRRVRVVRILGEIPAATEVGVVGLHSGTTLKREEKP
jgi:hypothetical protein